MKTQERKKTHHFYFIYLKTFKKNYFFGSCDFYFNFFAVFLNLRQTISSIVEKLNISAFHKSIILIILIIFVFYCFLLDVGMKLSQVSNISNLNVKLIRKSLDSRGLDLSPPENILSWNELSR